MDISILARNQCKVGISGNDSEKTRGIYGAQTETSLLDTSCWRKLRANYIDICKLKFLAVNPCLHPFVLCCCVLSRSIAESTHFHHEHLAQEKGACLHSIALVDLACRSSIQQVNSLSRRLCFHTSLQRLEPPLWQPPPLFAGPPHPDRKCNLSFSVTGRSAGSCLFSCADHNQPPY